MFSWFKWSSSPQEPDTVKQLPAENNAAQTQSLKSTNTSFQLYWQMAHETKKKDVTQIEQLKAKVNQAVENELATFQNFFDTWQQAIQQKSKEPIPCEPISEEDSQLIEKFQTLVDPFRKTIIAFFQTVDFVLQRIISTENKNTLSYTLANKYQLERSEQAINTHWQQLYWQLQQAQFDQQNNAFLVLSNLSITMLDTIINQLKVFQVSANQFFQNLIENEYLYQCHQIEDELHKWVVWPLAITLKDMKAKQEDIKQLLLNDCNNDDVVARVERKCNLGL